MLVLIHGGDSNRFVLELQCMESLEPWIAFFDQPIWEQTKEELESLAPQLRAVLESRAVEPRLLLRELSDESLALAIQKEFWWVDAFEELFVHRYEEKLIRWFYSWRVMNHEDVRDLVQDVYRRFLENRLESFDANCNFVPTSTRRRVTFSRIPSASEGCQRRASRETTKHRRGTTTPRPTWCVWRSRHAWKKRSTISHRCSRRSFA